MTSSEKWLRAGGALVCMTGLALALGGTAFAKHEGATTRPGKNGAIAFKRLDGQHSTGAIFAIDASGRDERRLTRPKPGIVDDQPDWSPDGSRLVFHRSGSPYAIYTVKSDGSDLKRLSPPCSASGPGVELTCEDGAGASFLPDGKHVVYTRSTGAVRRFPNGEQWIEHSDLVVRDLDGGNLRVLIRSRPYEGDYNSAHFAPDGSRLLYVRQNSSVTKPAEKHAIFVATADGKSRRQITPWSLDAGDNPDWSPDGKLIVFRAPTDRFEGSQVYVVRPDGAGLRQLTRFRPDTSVLSYSFSPDGKWITFAKADAGQEPDIFVMRPDGTGIRKVTRSPLWDSAPDWGPSR